MFSKNEKSIPSKENFVRSFAQPSIVSSLLWKKTLSNKTYFSFLVVYSDYYPFSSVLEIPNLDTKTERTLKCSEVIDPFVKFLKSSEMNNP